MPLEIYAIYVTLSGKDKSVAYSFAFGAFYDKINLGGIYNDAYKLRGENNQQTE